MKCFLCRSLPAIAFVLLTSWLLADESRSPSPPPPRSGGEGGKRLPSPPTGGRGVGGNVQDFVFLAEARPILVRLHVRVEGKPLSAAWDEFMKYLFADLDFNGDGVLSKEEAERAPRADQLIGAGAGAINNGRLFGLAAASLTMKELDTDKDGKVSRGELSTYYRENGLPPFQFQFDTSSNDAGGMMALYLGGSRPDPEVEKVSRAIFDLLDTDKDGKLTQKEWDAAPALLLARDENEDEIVSAQEVTPEDKPKGNRDSAAMMMALSQKSGATTSPLLVPISVSGQAPPELVHRLRERYDPSFKKTEVKLLDKIGGFMSKEAMPAPPKKQEAKLEPRPKANEVKKEEKKEPPTKLTRRQLHLDEATFGRLDANKDGALDDKELAAFVQREPDLCLTVSFDDKAEKFLTLASVAGRSAALADKVQMHDAFGFLDLGATRLELRRGDDDKPSKRLRELVQSQFSVQFKQADKDNNGYLDEKEAKESRLFGNAFKRIDRDGDGKLYEKEIWAFIERAMELQRRAAAGCATLVLRDQSRGLFDLLDTNRDGRLSVREINRAPKLLRQLDRQNKGYVRWEDIPKSYRLTLRRGSRKPPTNIQEAFIVERYFGDDEEETPALRGPAWFRKMDRNRDGDVSRKEFLFGEELFRKLDADGDGLISLEEAEKAKR